MTDWKNYIGKFATLVSNDMKILITKEIYMNMLEYKDKLVEESNFDDPDNHPYTPYETLDQAKSPKKKSEDAYVYWGLKKIIDKETKTSIEQEDWIPMKKFTTVTIDGKNTLIFLLNAFINEVKKYYEKNNYTFPVADEQLMNNIKDWTMKNIENPVTPLICLSEKIYDVNEFLKSKHSEFDDKLCNKLRTFFKDKNEKVPSGKIQIIVAAFTTFLKVLAIKLTTIVFNKRNPVTRDLILCMLRDLSNLIREKNATIRQELFDLITEYVNLMKPKKKGKDGDDEDDEDPAPKKRITKKPEQKPKPKPKGKSTTTKNGNSNGKKKPKKEEDDEEEVEEEEAEEAEEADDLEENLDDALGDNYDDWQEGNDE